MASALPGDEVVLLRAVEIAPGSPLSLQPGDIGRVEEITESECVATFSGVAVVVPLDVVQTIP